MKNLFILNTLVLGLMSFSAFGVSEVVYVESPTDTDGDGKPDQIYVSINRPLTSKKVSTLFAISPYSLGGNDTPNHNVDYDILPQDEELYKIFSGDVRKSMKRMNKIMSPLQTKIVTEASRYADVKAHSLGTGYSTGCPTVGDKAETLAAKAVIDWLNGRAKAVYEDGTPAEATWANGKVGMTGVSYNGTLPTMVATTGVEGLKAIVPIAAISNWYNYYRANGLVVNPGGYIGEDADVLGLYIVRKGACRTELDNLARAMGREHGDFTTFWQDRDYVPEVKNIKAATFIIHGQSDWNVKQKHAIDLWENLKAPKRMFLHKGGHGSTGSHGVPKKIQDWFDHFLEGDENGITSGPQVEVELPDGSLITQYEWPHEKTKMQKLFFGDDTLDERSSRTDSVTIIDSGKTKRLEALAENPQEKNQGRLIFLTEAFNSDVLVSGTPKVSLNLAVMNRKAANITVAVLEYDQYGRSKVITRGWADPQNYRNIKRGEKLVPGKTYQLNFPLEPKEYKVKSGSRIGVLVTATDYEYTLRPDAGTEIQVNLGTKSFIELGLGK